MANDCSDCFKVMRLVPVKAEGAVAFEGIHCQDTQVTRFYPVKRSDAVEIEGESNYPNGGLAIARPVKAVDGLRMEAATWCGPCDPPCVTCSGGAVTGVRDDKRVATSLTLTILNWPGTWCGAAYNGVVVTLDACASTPEYTTLPHCTGCTECATGAILGAQLVTWRGRTLLDLFPDECVPQPLDVWAWVHCHADPTANPPRCEYYLIVELEPASHNICNVPPAHECCSSNPEVETTWDICRLYRVCRQLTADEVCGWFDFDLTMGCAADGITAANQPCTHCNCGVEINITGIPPEPLARMAASTQQARPGILTRAANFARAMLDAARGNEVDDAEYERRLRACDRCAACHKQDSTHWYCTLCGCPTSEQLDVTGVANLFKKLRLAGTLCFYKPPAW